MYARVQVVGDGCVLLLLKCYFHIMQLTYRGEHVNPRDDVPVLATRVVHEVDGVSHIVRPEK